MHLWLSGGAWTRVFVPVTETVLLFVLIGAAGVTGGIAPRWVRPILLGLVTVALATGIVVSGAEALFQYIWGRSFVFRADVPMVRGGLLLLFGEIGPVVERLVPVAIGLTGLVALAIAALLVLPIDLLLSRRARSGDTRGPGAILPVALLPVVLILAAVITPPVEGYERGAVTPMVIRAMTDTGRLELRELDSAEVADDPARADDSANADDTAGTQEQERVQLADRYAFPGIRDRDIHFFMIEAYGYAVFSRDHLHGELTPYLDRLVDALENAGYGIRSNYLRAPVFGGFSWLSEATVLTGQPIDSQPKFEELLEISREREIQSLSRMLHDGGYYTLMVKPGTVHGSWPEGWDLFRFERSLVAYDGDFDYRGPWFSYVAITDQHAVWTTHNYLRRQRAVGGAAEDRPVYVHYQLVSSHTPFNRIPPYIEDWDSLGDGTIYHEREEDIRTFNNTWGGGTELDEGYVASIAYVLTVLAEYIDRFMDHERSPILIFMGDHQPQRPIREQDAGASVPVHIASRDRALLEALEREGYQRGIRGSQPPPHPPMMDFFPMLRRIARAPIGVSTESR